MTQTLTRKGLRMYIRLAIFGLAALLLAACGGGLGRRRRPRGRVPHRGVRTDRAGARDADRERRGGDRGLHGVGRVRVRRARRRHRPRRDGRARRTAWARGRGIRRAVRVRRLYGLRQSGAGAGLRRAERPRPRRSVRGRSGRLPAGAARRGHGSHVRLHPRGGGSLPDRRLHAGRRGAVLHAGRAEPDLPEPDRRARSDATRG